MSKRAIVVLAVVWIVLLVAGVSTSLTLMFCNVNASDEISLGSAHIVSAQEYSIIERFSRLREVLDVVEEDYYQPVDEEKLLQGAIDGMLGSLEDPYTFYYTPTAMEESTEHQSGTYHGVGLQLLAEEQGRLVLTRTFSGGSSQEAGILSGDILIAVDGVPVSGETRQEMNKALDAVRGPDQTTVRLTVLRGDEQLEVEVVRGEVTMNRVDHRMLEDQIGYIAIYEFMGDDVEGFREAVRDLQNQGMRALIIDVRSNPGGLLDHVVSIADQILPQGLIVYTQDRAGQRESYYSDTSSLDLPMAVLINGTSASASEILAGAIQDYGVGTLVGEKSFGKGIVQTIISFRDDGAGMQLTTSAYYTPSGRSIHGTGIAPDVEVAAEEDFDVSMSIAAPEDDLQLQAALNLLKEQLK